MKAVFKYNLQKGNVRNSPSLPMGAEIIRVDVQGQSEELVLWALVEIGEYVWKQRIIRIAGTGQLIEEKIIRYINTFHTNNRTLWWHAFEVEA